MVFRAWPAAQRRGNLDLECVSRKRGWRDEASADLQAAKKRSGLGDRDDIQTWVDLHDAEEGRKPVARFAG